MSEALRADRGPCTECGTPHVACVGPDYCCDECLHLDESWDGYEQPERARPTADVTREPTGGQELREAIVRGLARAHGASYVEWADAVLALPELAALLADAERVRDLQAKVNRVRNLAGDLDPIDGYEAAMPDLLAHDRRHVASRIRAALDGDQ